jgi:hypothetical protein
MTNVPHVSKEEMLKTAEHDIREEMERVFNERESMLFMSTNTKEGATAYHGYNVSTHETALQITHLLMERPDLQMLVLTNLMVLKGETR